jgi:hypothetical protein
MDLREIGWGVMDWIHLAQDTDQWRALVNTVMKLQVHRMLGYSWVSAQLSTFHAHLTNRMKIRKK